jgi:DNA polymerase-1
MPNTLLLVDAYSQIYRAYFAIRSLTGPDGRPVNAIFGFTKMLRKLLVDCRPTHVAVVYDLGAPRQRLALLPSYKEQRPPTPPPLAAQLPAIREVLAALGLPIVERDGEEADDLIATLATQAGHAGATVLIASNDKDFYQLVDERIRVLRADTGETKVVDAAAVRQRYGVDPGQIADYLSLVGDTVDNIPGVPGIGPKTAAKLLNARADLAAQLPAHADRLRFNRQLIALRRDLSLPVPWTALTPRPADPGKLRALYAQFGFRSLLAELAPPEPDLFSPR